MLNDKSLIWRSAVSDNANLEKPPNQASSVKSLMNKGLIFFDHKSDERALLKNIMLHSYYIFSHSQKIFSAQHHYDSCKADFFLNRRVRTEVAPTKPIAKTPNTEEDSGTAAVTTLLPGRLL